MVRNFVHPVLCGLETYQGFGVNNPFFLQEIFNIITFFLMKPCATLQLVNFFVEIGILFSLTSTPYNDNTFSYYLPQAQKWYTSLWRFASNILYKLDISEDYQDIPLLQVRDVYLMQVLTPRRSQNSSLRLKQVFGNIDWPKA